MYADDIVLLSETASGLQNSINGVEKFCSKWGLSVNLNKSKVLVFNKPGRLEKTKFYFGEQTLENVVKYKYLGLIFQASGCFNDGKCDLSLKGLKALYKLKNMFNSSKPNISTMSHVFDHTIKPITLYACEIWGAFNTKSKKLSNSSSHKVIKAYDTLPAEKVHLKFCKFAIGVWKNAPSNAVYGELGRFPMYITVIRQMLSFLKHILSTTSAINPFLKDAWEENKELDGKGINSWFSSIKFVCNELGIDDVECPDNSIFESIQRLEEDFIVNWKKTISDNNNARGHGNKLRFYNKFKIRFMLEPYLLLVKNQPALNSLIKFRTSCHNLQIEKGRHQNLDVSDRICHCDNHKVEDELHFAMECPSYNNLRQLFFESIFRLNTNFVDLDNEAKLIWLLSNEDQSICINFAKFIHKCFEVRSTKI